MLDTKLIIVFGVSGVGKTTACAEYANRNHDVIHSSASDLLRLHRETAGMRTIDEVMQDQHTLVDLVCALRAETRASLVLLDAHSLIVVAGRKIVIPADIIAAMNPSGLIFFKATGDVVFSRRALRGDITNIAPQEIERWQEKSLRAAQSYASQIPCRLSVLDVSQGTDLAGAIGSLS
ncbi:ATP-binding protein [Agrobacterium pusense]|uniref:ATP-binding protein n=1 Tax=Agrobacterium pusense TaxID=648995 RepID=UPI003D0ACFA2